MTIEAKRFPHSCNNFEDSGEKFPVINEPICKNCGWVINTHHQWFRMKFISDTLGPGWQCKQCGRTAYDKDGRCSVESPPIDYPACSKYSW